MLFNWITQEGFILFEKLIPFWLISLVLFILVIILMIKPLKKMIKKIFKAINDWITRASQQIFLNLTNQKFRNLLKEGWTKWKDFYTLKINFDKRKLFEIFAFAFIIFFINWLILFSSIIIKSSFQNVLDKTWGAVIELLFLLILLYALGGIYLFRNSHKEYDPYFFSLLIILITLLPNISLLTRWIIIPFFIFILLPGFYYSWEKPKWKLLVTLIIMSALLLLGLTITSALYSEEQTTINFRNCNTQQIIPNINMSCSSSIAGGKINGKIADFWTECNISPKIKNFTTEITYLFINGNKSQVYIPPENQISFLPPEKIKGIQFIINSNNSCMDITWPVYFKNYEEYKSDKENFITYIFALLFLIFITIPPAVKNFIKLLNEK
jgi:hypothetical protein